MTSFFTATRLQAATYLFGICLFSISFLVFLNSSVSFVITDLIKERNGVGNAVGTLGFADELVALAACPIWGALSDRIGVRLVSRGRPFRQTDADIGPRRWHLWATSSWGWP